MPELVQQNFKSGTSLSQTAIGFECSAAKDSHTGICFSRSTHRCQKEKWRTNHQFKLSILGRLNSIEGEIGHCFKLG